MKLGFNEATALGCREQTLAADLEACEKYGFDFIEIRFDCLKEFLKKHALNELADWFKGHKLKPYAYNTLIFFNQRDAEGVREIDEEVDFVIEVGNAIDMKTMITVPSFDIGPLSIGEIREEAVQRLRYLSDRIAPHGMRISLEFCGAHNCSINQLGTALDVVEAVDRDNVGVTLDTFHFHAMGSRWEDLERLDGRKIFACHLNDSEDLPVGSMGDDKRLWPGDGCIDHDKIFRTLKNTGFDGVCTVELFRPEYYTLSHDENVRVAKEKTSALISRYFDIG